MEILGDAVAWFGDPANWTGYAGIPQRVWEHVRLSAVSVVGAAAVALPLGLLIGHTRRGEFLVVSIANLGRAIPSFAILGLGFQLFLALGFGLSDWPTIVALFLLAVPPMITNTYVGVRGVDADTVEAARGMGMSGRDILTRIELPLAAPLIVTGLRTSAVQVVATATLAAYIAGGGLGRFIVDGFAQGKRFMIVGGALLVAVLAILTELSLGIVERLVTPGRQERSLYGDRPSGTVAPSTSD